MARSTAYARRVLSLRGGRPFGSRLVTHFGYHKTMTVFFNEVLTTIGSRFGVPVHGVYTDASTFNADVGRCRGTAIFTANGFPGVDWDAVGHGRCTHIVRDPRDMVVSGYHYHLWCEERWCVEAPFNWDLLRSHRRFEDVEPGLPVQFEARSYQTVLAALPADEAFLLEYIRSSFTFSGMTQWPIDRPNVLELRFEDVIGHEEATFDQVLAHYEAHPKVRAFGVDVAGKRSLSAKKSVGDTGARQHARSGQPGEWRNSMPSEVTAVIGEEQGPLLARYGYSLD